jgi:hypothetical protein
MNTKKVTKKDFEGFFTEAMKITEVEVADEYGSSIAHVRPCLIIRDFSIDCETSDGVWDSTICDTEFVDFDEAWEYFQSVGPYSRVMANGGQIFACYYDEESQ